MHSCLHEVVAAAAVAAVAVAVAAVSAALLALMCMYERKRQKRYCGHILVTQFVICQAPGMSWPLQP